MMTQALSRVGPRAIPRLRSARKHSRFRVFRDEGLESTEPCRPLSVMTKLSTLNRPLALLNMLELSVVGVDDIPDWVVLEVSILGGLLPPCPA